MFSSEKTWAGLIVDATQLKAILALGRSACLCSRVTHSGSVMSNSGRLGWLRFSPADVRYNPQIMGLIPHSFGPQTSFKNLACVTTFPAFRTSRRRSEYSVEYFDFRPRTMTMRLHCRDMPSISLAWWPGAWLNLSTKFVVFGGQVVLGFDVVV